MAGRLFPGPWRYTLMDLVIATAVVVMTWQYRATSDQDVAIGFAMAAALVARRRFPVPVMAVVSALALLQVFVCPGIPTSYDVAVLIAMASVVTHTERLWLGYAAGGGVLIGNGIVAADKGLRLGTDAATLDGYGEFLAFATGSVAVWLTAYVLRTRRVHLAILQDRAARAERERDHLAELAAADERAGIARELHDVVAHSLAVMIVQADGASYAVDTDTDRAREAVRTIAATGREALDDMRRIVEVLRGTSTPDPDDRRRVGLEQLEPLVDRARNAGLAVDLRLDGEPAGLSAADELTVFRLAQEGLTNALRHAGQGANVTVALRFRAGTVVVEVTDDGAGRLATPPAPGVRGNGLIGMRERVSVHGGTLTAGPRLGAGWQVTAVVPVKEAA